MDGEEATSFGRYRLREPLGRGGMGEVWRAYDTLIGRTVALKVLHANYANDPQFRERFRREAQKAASLDERHVVPVFDIGEVDGRLFVTMPVIKGQDLQRLITAGPVQPLRAVGIIEQVATALAAAHVVGLVHRDVKPSNVLVAEDDFCYLIDFGIARAVGEAGLTSTGTTVGTWSYMAPERFRSGLVEPSSDIYALACVLYECLTGQPPFPGNTLEQIAVAHMMESPPKPSRCSRANVPVAMDAVIAKGLAKDPTERYRSATDLAAAARAALIEMLDSSTRKLTPTAPVPQANLSRTEAAPQPELPPTKPAPQLVAPITATATRAAAEPRSVRDLTRDVPARSQMQMASAQDLPQGDLSTHRRRAVVLVVLGGPLLP